MSRIFKLALVCLVVLTVSAEAAPPQNNVASYNRLRYNFNHAAPYTQQQEEEKNKIDERYDKLMADESFVYYMDKKSARWIPCPNTQDEYIIDVWIRLEPIDGNEQSKYSYPSKYFLEHYYLRPAKQQVQFLAELEVTGRPDNNVEERAYSAQNWEALVPESIEDGIYRAVVKKMKKKSGGVVDGPLTVGRIMEDVFRVSI